MKARILCVALLGAALAASACEGKRRLREELEVPAADPTRPPVALLRMEVDERRGPPDWIDHEREDDEHVYGVGVVRAGGNRLVDLYRVQREAEASLAEWLAARGLRAQAPRGLQPPLDVELRAIEFEEVAYARETGSWYCLARLDREKEAEHVEERVQALDESLESAYAVLSDARKGAVAAALRVLFDLDRRAQYAAQYAAYTGEALELPFHLDPEALEALARETLRAHGVRGELEGESVPGLREALEATLDRVSLEPRPDGRARIEIRLGRREVWIDGRPFLYYEGTMRVDVEGERGDVRMVRLLAKGSGLDATEAEIVAGRLLADQVSEELMATLRQVALR